MRNLLANVDETTHEDVLNRLKNQNMGKTSDEAGIFSKLALTARTEKIRSITQLLNYSIHKKP